MKSIFKAVLLILCFAFAGQGRASESVMTPDGYLYHPAFELGAGGSTNSYTYGTTYTYSGTTVANSTGKSEDNFTHLFLSMYFPVDPCFTLVGGLGYLLGGTGTSSSRYRQVSWSDTENGTGTATFAGTLSWNFSVKFYTR
jgi:hypothetical protein